MELTITEKILRAHSDNKSAVAGDFILANVDRCLANDITAPIAIEVFERVIEGTDRSLFEDFANSGLVLVPDHFIKTSPQQYSVKYSENLLINITF